MNAKCSSEGKSFINSAKRFDKLLGLTCTAARTNTLWNWSKSFFPIRWLLLQTPKPQSLLSHDGLNKTFD